MGLEWVIIFGLEFFVGTVGVRGRFEARALTDLTWLIVGWLGCWGLVVVGIVGVAWVGVRTNVGV